MSAPNGEPFRFTVPADAIDTVYRVPIDYEPALDLWTCAVSTTWDQGVEHGWRVGWYTNDDGRPGHLVAVTWLAGDPEPPRATPKPAVGWTPTPSAVHRWNRGYGDVLMDVLLGPEWLRPNRTPFQGYGASTVNDWNMTIAPRTTRLLEAAHTARWRARCAWKVLTGEYHAEPVEGW